MNDQPLTEIYGTSSLTLLSPEPKAAAQGRCVRSFDVPCSISDARLVHHQN